jgi:hypothetical protein
MPGCGLGLQGSAVELREGRIRGVRAVEAGTIDPILVARIYRDRDAVEILDEVLDNFGWTAVD